MTVSVVILSYQPGDWLKSCLESVADHADEVVLVDNGSPNDEATTFGKAVGATIVSLPTNLGYAAGVNAGVRRARGDVIALLNDDAAADPRWLPAAQRVLADPAIAAVTPRIRRSGLYREVILPGAGETTVRSVTADGREVLEGLLGAAIDKVRQQDDEGKTARIAANGLPFYIPVSEEGAGADILIDGEPPPAGPVCRLLNKAGGYVRSDGILGDLGDETPDDTRWDEPAETFFASGTAFAARVDTLSRIGGFAEPFFAYYEDGDWCWRARLAGMRIVYDPAATVVHRHSATSGGYVSPLVRQLAERNRLLCLVRNAPRSVVAGALRSAVRPGPVQQGRRSMLARVPWALSSRAGVPAPGTSVLRRCGLGGRTPGQN